MIAIYREGRVHISDCYAQKDEVRSVTGAFWDKKRRLWDLPITQETVDLLTSYGAHIDPIIKQDLEQKKSSFKTTENVKSAKFDLSTINMNSVKGCKPYSHQLRGYLLGLTNDAFVYAQDMGTGKTLTMIAVIGERYRLGQIKRVLIVSPKTLVYTWQKEFETYANFPVELCMMTGKLVDRRKRLQKFAPFAALGVAIINYDSVHHFEKEFKEYKPDLIVLDECQRIKCHTSLASKLFHELAKTTRYRYAMSGTIIQNKVIDLFSICKFVNSEIFGNSFHLFRSRYCELGFHKEVVGHRNLDELRYKFHSIAFRVTKDEVLDLPETSDLNVYVDLDPMIAQPTYNRVKNQMCAELENGETITATTALTKLLRLQQMAGGFPTVETVQDGIVTTKTKQFSINTKMEALKELLYQHVVDDEKKVIIFCRFTAEFNEIKRQLNIMKIPFVAISGEVSAEQRDWSVNQFQTNNICKVFLGQIQCVSTGLTLTKAHIAIYYSMSFNYADYDQSRARIHRISQTMPCVYIHLLSRNTVDEYILECLKKKRSLSESILDDFRTLIT